MDESGQNPVNNGSPAVEPTNLAPRQRHAGISASLRGDLRYAAGKPTSVTVFGVLNIVFGGLGLLCTPVGIFATIASSKTLEAATGYKMFLLFSNIAGFG